MVIFTPAKINESFYLLRAPDYCIYLLLDEIGAIIETGISQIIPDVVQSIEKFGVDKKTVKYIIVPHSHFDHAGGVSMLKRYFPSAKILGSSYTSHIFQDEHQISLIRKGLEKTSLHPWYSSGEIFILKEEVEVVKDEEEISLGKNIKIKVIETPGHSPCAISLYEEKNKIFIISDNFGSIYPSQEEGEDVLKDVDIVMCKDMPVQFKGLKVWTTAFEKFDLYLENFEKVKNLNIEYLCFGHLGILSGKVASSFFEFSKNQAEKFKKMIEEKIFELKNEEEVVKYIQDTELKELLHYFPPFVVRWGTRAMVKNIIV